MLYGKQVKNFKFEFSCLGYCWGIAVTASLTTSIKGHRFLLN